MDSHHIKTLPYENCYSLEYEFPICKSLQMIEFIGVKYIDFSDIKP